MNETVALIPARGGSKRLPRKNILDFFGKPMLAYSVEAARESTCFSRIVVSTEDEEIAQVALAAGAEVANRGLELATSTATVVDVCLNFLASEEREGRRYGNLCCLYATAPLRSAEDIRAVMALLEPARCEFAAAVTRFDLPAHQAMLIDGVGGMRPMFPDVCELRAEKIGALVVDNGSTYAVTVEALRRERTFLGSTLRGYTMDRARSIDIDDEDDLQMAAYYYKRLQQ